MIKLKDCDIEVGCPTCNYGSRYINEILFWNGEKVAHFEACQMYEYLMSVGDLMMILLNNIEDMAEMTWEEFVEWFDRELKNTINKGNDWSDWDVTVEVYECNEYEWKDMTRRS